MDQEDKCMTYGHVGPPRTSLEYTMQLIDGAYVCSKRRKRITICNACGGRIE